MTAKAFPALDVFSSLVCASVVLACPGWTRATMAPSCGDPFDGSRDVIFLMDVAGDVSDVTFYKSKAFIKKIITRSIRNVSGTTKYACILFNDDTSVTAANNINGHDSLNISDLDEKLQKDLPYEENSTEIGIIGATKRARDILSDNENSTRLVTIFYICTGNFGVEMMSLVDNITALLDEMRRIRNVTVFAMGIENFNSSYLEELVGAENDTCRVKSLKDWNLDLWPDVTTTDSWDTKMSSLLIVFILANFTIFILVLLICIYAKKIGPKQKPECKPPEKTEMDEQDFQETANMGFHRSKINSPSLKKQSEEQDANSFSLDEPVVDDDRQTATESVGSRSTMVSDMASQNKLVSRDSVDDNVYSNRLAVDLSKILDKVSKLPHGGDSNQCDAERDAELTTGQLSGNDTPELSQRKLHHDGDPDYVNVGDIIDTVSESSTQEDLYVNVPKQRPETYMNIFRADVKKQLNKIKHVSRQIVSRISSQFHDAEQHGSQLRSAQHSPEPATDGNVRKSDHTEHDYVNKEIIQAIHDRI